MNKLRHFERIAKGFANHRRIEIMMLLDRYPELSLTEVTGMLKINFKTGAEHIRRLAIPGLVWKRSDGKAIRHALSPLGKNVLTFLRTLE